MVIKIKDKEIKLKFSFRSQILYENIQNKSFAPDTTTDILVYFYCVILASEKDIELSFDEFLDMVDENPHLIIEFSEFIVESTDRNKMLTSDDTDSKKKVKK